MLNQDHWTRSDEQAWNNSLEFAKALRQRRERDWINWKLRNGGEPYRYKYIDNRSVDGMIHD